MPHIFNVKKIAFSFVFVFVILLSNLSAQSEKKQKEHPEWSKNLSIYEVNLRQFTNEGTLEAFSSHLPALKKMNVGILWFMPVTPIGEVNRKGSLGSYYSVKDYTALNPEFGTLADFKKVVEQAHELGMYVIIDWVANHTAWDNIWMNTNPEFYSKDKDGKFISPFDWTDVVALNFDNKELWNAMRDAMKFWVDECNVDGFRCDVAAMVPLEFWNWVMPQLQEKKKLFMLAEAHEPELHEAFDMTYSWQLKDLFVGVGKNEKTVLDFYNHFEKEKNEYHKDAYRMTFTSNHDENSWHGTDKERFGDAAKMFAVISNIVPGMPLVYSGQEAGLDKRLLFFEKDPIEWKQSEMRDLYTRLFALKKKNKALWNGAAGGEFSKIKSNNKSLFTFMREKDNNKIVAMFNISDSPIDAVIEGKSISGSYKDFSTNKKCVIKNSYSTRLEAWGYKILYK
ncbi:MAG: alpha amylase catalytic region [Ignavibacteria bacterium]|nr:MAG: alpha amylase catalytic region [Ignavibacteria bacterium]KAF0158570.1 MAG: alpha amylase catalytic region [Ignavibacteria bacterium]